MSEKRTCLECGDPLYGRSDQKFCSDHCRNTYNNKLDVNTKNLIRNTNNRLRKNYKILTELNKSGKTKVTRLRLYDRNFDFNFFTSIYITKAGKIYYYLYDQGYLELENDYFLLIKKNLD
jgi:predicted nucleic acid-binding Zn ribbon protein